MQQQKHHEPIVLYEGWKLFEDKINRRCVAEKSIGSDDEICQVVLKANRDIPYEGYWPGRSLDPPRILITGSCIYSDCWRIQFESHTPKTTPPRPFILGLAHDRERIKKYLKKKRPISYVDVPIQTCVYQDKLLSWQANCVAEEGPDVERLLYHLPVSIYHTFIDEIEVVLGAKLPMLHELLDEYTDMLKKKCVEAFHHIGASVEFCDPHKGPNGEILDAHAADRAPYLEVLGLDGVMGIEDLAQLTIGATIAEEFGVTIPCRVGVLGIPHPLSQCDGEHCCRRRLSMDSLLSGNFV
uniref:Uncharacterized protein n=1 Tax=Candidatus Kentrum sp. FM TaxID=2126340 RepID=A0A450SWL8_9GAMM|nr:MAG: hypothetical protein BECKFM1743C_GA0114222_101097 [Candidatus Kentron sp. FM]VFJ58359.1 MAG: hypothetical protein BECKFM1743A_GA0114220_102133 [Candidatus Kentron sp. FM]VFK09418.1 MAG: hypothetical protein BECKFM1743B_GA0114221_101047 [Candidatus Kentron sp. FM]